MHNLFKTSLLLIISTLLSLIIQKAEAALFVAGRGKGAVLRYDDRTGEFLDVFIPQGSCGLKAPSSLAFGSDDRLYVSDYFNSSVLRFDAKTGECIDTFIPSGSGELISPESIVFGPGGDLYIGGLDGNGVRRYNGKTGAFIDTLIPKDPSTGSKLNTPSFVFYSDTEIFVSSVFPNGGVLRYDKVTGATNTFIPPNLAPKVTGGLAIGLDGLLYVGDFIPDLASIRRYDPKTGNLIDTFVAPGSGGLSKASRLLFQKEDDNLYLYVTSFGSDSVLRYDGKTGAFISAFVPSGSGGLKDPIGLAFTPTPVSASVPEPTSYLAILGFGAYLSTSLIQKSKQ